MVATDYPIMCQYWDSYSGHCYGVYTLYLDRIIDYSVGCIAPSGNMGASPGEFPTQNLIHSVKSSV